MSGDRFYENQKTDGWEEDPWGEGNVANVDTDDRPPARARRRVVKARKTWLDEVEGTLWRDQGGDQSAGSMPVRRRIITRSSQQQRRGDHPGGSVEGGGGGGHSVVRRSGGSGINRPAPLTISNATPIEMDPPHIESRAPDSGRWARPTPTMAFPTYSYDRRRVVGDDAEEGGDPARSGRRRMSLDGTLEARVSGGDGGRQRDMMAMAQSSSSSTGRHPHHHHRTSRHHFVYRNNGGSTYNDEPVSPMMREDFASPLFRPNTSTTVNNHNNDRLFVNEDKDAPRGQGRVSRSRNLKLLNAGTDTARQSEPGSLKRPNPSTASPMALDEPQQYAKRRKVDVIEIVDGRPQSKPIAKPVTRWNSPKPAHMRAKDPQTAAKKADEMKWKYRWSLHDDRWVPPEAKLAKSTVINPAATATSPFASLPNSSSNPLGKGKASVPATAAGAGPMSETIPDESTLNASGIVLPRRTKALTVETAQKPVERSGRAKHTASSSVGPKPRKAQVKEEDVDDAVSLCSTCGEPIDHSDDSSYTSAAAASPLSNDPAVSGRRRPVISRSRSPASAGSNYDSAMSSRSDGDSYDDDEEEGSAHRSHSAESVESLESFNMEDDSRQPRKVASKGKGPIANPSGRSGFARRAQFPK